MSHQNVEIVRKMWTVWTSEEMSTWLDFLHPEIEWHTRGDEPDAGVYRGREEVEKLMEFWDDNFDGLQVHAEEFIAAGEHVVVPSRVSGRGRSSGVEAQLHYTFVYAVRDGKIVEVREFTGKEKALEAVGLDE